MSIFYFAYMILLTHFGLQKEKQSGGKASVRK